MNAERPSSSTVVMFETRPLILKPLQWIFAGDSMKKIVCPRLLNSLYHQRWHGGQVELLPMVLHTIRSVQLAILQQVRTEIRVL